MTGEAESQNAKERFFLKGRLRGLCTHGCNGYNLCTHDFITN